MSIWGKLAGAAAGMAVGGPLGAVLGGFAGHIVIDRDAEAAEPDKQVAFTIGVIALGAKMAKVDGAVTKDEVRAFKEVFRVPEGEARNVARIFDMAKQDVAGFESYAKQLARLFKDDPDMLHNILEGLFHIAEADKVLHPSERDYLATVAQAFRHRRCGIPRHLGPACHVGTAQPVRNSWRRSGLSGEALHRHYRKLMMENHPDKLIARGLPQEMIDIATKKIAALNEAYDEIRHAPQYQR